MAENRMPHINDADLRQLAEKLLDENYVTASSSITIEDTLRLHHELLVHQIELELQNEILRKSRDDAEALLEKYTDLYDSAPVSYFSLDRCGTILTANLSGAGLIGKDRPQLIGLYFEHFVADANRTDFAVFLEKVFTCSRPLTCELMLLKDATAPVCVHIEALAAASGQECRIALIDITEQEKLERDFKLASFTIDNLNDAVHWVLKDSRLLKVNSTACRMLKYTTEELENLSIPDIDPKYPMDDWDENWDKLKTAGQGRIESIHRTKDGHDFPVEISLSYFEVDGKEIACSIVRDITERKQVEQELLESEERYRRLFEVESDAIFIIDFETSSFIDVNPAAEKLYGYNREEFLQLTSQDISAEPEAIASTQTEIGFKLHRKKDGTEFPAESSGNYFSYKGRMVHVAAIRDISLRKQAEKILAMSHAELVRLVEERTKSLSQTNEQLQREIEERKRTEQELIDHQRILKTMTFELSMAEERERDRIAGELHDQVGQRLIVSKMKLDALADQLSINGEYSEHIEKVANLINQSIQDIRSLTFQIRPPLLASAGLEATVQWLAVEFKEDFGFFIDYHDDLKPKPLRYEIRSTIFQIIRELLMNVAKHAGTKSAHISLKREDNFIVINITDEGVGFDMTEVATRKAKSGGFGLFNVQQRIEYLGGHYSNDSSPGKGTRATIMVPLDSSEKACHI